MSFVSYFAVILSFVRFPRDESEGGVQVEGSQNCFISCIFLFDHPSIFLANDAVISAKSLEVLVMTLEALHEEVKPLGHKVSWAKISNTLVV